MMGKKKRRLHSQKESRQKLDLLGEKKKEKETLQILERGRTSLAG